MTTKIELVDNDLVNQDPKTYKIPSAIAEYYLTIDPTKAYTIEINGSNDDFVFNTSLDVNGDTLNSASKRITVGSKIYDVLGDNKINIIRSKADTLIYLKIINSN
tara:strand:+ start:899 stop:1213 length:315 start_codon:yes stop_codon:yes gene_type:complete